MNIGLICNNVAFLSEGSGKDSIYIRQKNGKIISCEHKYLINKPPERFNCILLFLDLKSTTFQDIVDCVNEYVKLNSISGYVLIPQLDKVTKDMIYSKYEIKNSDLNFIETTVGFDKFFKSLE